VVSNVLLDEPVLDGRLAAKGSGLGLAPTIPVGMRAVTVRVNDVASVAGFVLPGMHVDVLVTGKPPNVDGNMTATALQNVLVLSSGQVMQADARGQPISAATVTLLVSPEDAETLTLAGSDGRIQLILRNSSDAAIEKTSGRQVLELYNGNKHAAPVPDKKPAPVAAKPKPVVVAAAPPPPPLPPPPVAAPVVIPPAQVVVIRGTQKSVETFPNGSASN
jgi:pilus assembly protein CpaB